MVNCLSSIYVYFSYISDILAWYKSQLSHFLLCWLKGLRFSGSKEDLFRNCFQLCSVLICTQFITKLSIWGDAQMSVSFVHSWKSEHQNEPEAEVMLGHLSHISFQRIWQNFKTITENPEMKPCGHFGKAELECITHSFYAQNSFKSATVWSNIYGMN
jgi:uncharacterized protein Usg